MQPPNPNEATKATGRSTDDLVLLLSGVRGDTRRYRSLHPYEQLRMVGVSCAAAHLTDPQVDRLASRASYVIFHRVAWDRNVERLINSLRARQGVAIFDTDDLLFDPDAFQFIDSPDFEDRRRVALYQEEMHRYRRALELCDAVTTSTDYLAEQARPLGKPVWVLRNAFSLEMLARSQAAHRRSRLTDGRVVIGYACGTPTHNRDFAVARPALQEILRRYPQVELWLVGPLNPGGGWGDCMARLKRIKLVPWRELPQILVQFDINIAPLVMDNPFALSKSEIKYVEAGLVRVPTVASPTDSFRFAIRPGENGFLAQNEHEWVQALAELIEQAELRTVIGERAYQDVLQRYHPEVRAREFVNTLDQISQRVISRPFQRPSGSVATVASREGAMLLAREMQGMERSPLLWRWAWYSWRFRGPRTLLRQALVYCRRLAAPYIPYRRGSNRSR